MENNWFIFTICIASIFNGLVGLAIGAAKHRAGFGFLLGILLSVVGWIIVALMPSVETPPARVCPYCHGPLDATATVCCHCGRDLPDPRRPPVGVTRKCPACGMPVKLSASACPFCVAALISGPRL